MKLKASQKPISPPDPTAFRLDDFLPYQLSMASSRVARLFSRAFERRFEVSIPEWRLVAVVGRHGTLSPSAVGELTGMDKVKVSRAAANLTARGLVKQAADPNDGRARRLSLTRRGTSVYQGLIPLARELEASVAAGLSDPEWARLRKTLTKLNEHMRALDEPDDDAEAS